MNEPYRRQASAAEQARIQVWHARIWPCFCQGDDPVWHKHYREKPHTCARCGTCAEYRPRIPEAVCIELLIGPAMTEREAADLLLGGRR